MKSKKMTYLLGGLVFLIWGTIVYRIVIGLQADDDVPLPVTANTPKRAYDDYSSRPDTGKLLLNYRDPFGVTPAKDTSTSVKVVRAAFNTAAMRVPAVRNNVPAFDWSTIRYSGFIRNPDTKRLISVMSIQGRSVMLQEGETQADLKLLKNLKDSVKISYRGISRFIKLNN